MTGDDILVRYHPAQRVLIREGCTEGSQSREKGDPPLLMQYERARDLHSGMFHAMPSLSSFLPATNDRLSGVLGIHLERMEAKPSI